MPRITDVRERRGKARVFVDGEFWAVLDAETIIGRGLDAGTLLSEDELYEVRVAGERTLAMGRALNLLAYRARTRQEVRERLESAGYLDETVESVVLRLQEIGYLDDEQYARELARQKARKYGPRRVYGDLLKSGVDASAAGKMVDEEFAGRSELEEAFEAAARRYNESEVSGAQARRVYGFLTRRGYSAEVCAEIASKYRWPSSQEAGE